MPERRGRSGSRSLRFKLASWFVLVFFLIQTTLVGGVVFFRREVIQQSLDDSLSKAAKAMVDNLLAAEVTWDETRIESLVPSGSKFAFYAIRDQDGVVLVAHDVSDADKLPFSAWEVVPAGPVGGVHTTIRSERAEELAGVSSRLRLITLPFRYNDSLFFFQAGVRDQALDRLLGPFFDLVAIGVPVGLLAAALAGWIIAGRAVAPIQRLSNAARDVSPTNLNERFEVPTNDPEIVRLEEELNSALGRLEVGYKAQDQFISNVSHELRTPIAVLLTQAQVAKMGEQSLEKGYAFVNKAEVVMKRLGKLVNSFLVLTRADLTSKRAKDTVSIIDVVLDCMKACQLSANQKQVRLIPTLADSDDDGDGLTLTGDTELLQTMVENLVHNAISHSPVGGSIAIDAECTETSIQIAVRDQGPGIPEDYLERIFDRFVQAPQASDRQEGLGLGLAIASGVAQLHGGTITVTNNEDAGCSFVVTLSREERPLNESSS